MDHWRTKHSIKTWNTTLASNKFYDQRLLRLHDDRAPDRQVQTEEFWARLAEFEAATSELAREELEQTPDPGRRTQLLKLLAGLTLHPITTERRELARHYVDAEVFTLIMLNDALESVNPVF